VLVDHPDAGVDGVAGGVEVPLLAVDDHGPRGGFVQSVEDVHQRRLASAVLAEQGVDRAAFDGQVHLVVGEHPREPFGDRA
jgi:hypothetical protein